APHLDLPRPTSLLMLLKLTYTSITCSGMLHNTKLGGYYPRGFPYIVTSAAPPIPRLCCNPRSAPSTCRSSAMPRSCQFNSAHCARPVAPSGCPFEIRPPDGFTTHFPPYVTAP